jgi:hypothetical protein
MNSININIIVTIIIKHDITMVINYLYMFKGRPYPWARLVYQFIKLYVEVYTFTASHDF